MSVGYLHLINHRVPNKPVCWCLVFTSGQPSCAGFSYFIILAAVHNVLVHKKSHQNCYCLTYKLRVKPSLKCRKKLHFSKDS